MLQKISKTFTFFWGIDIVKKDVHAVVCWLFAVGKIAYSTCIHAGQAFCLTCRCMLCSTHFKFLFMKITPTEFIKKEFPNWDGGFLPPDVWLRKMQEFSVLMNAKIDLARLLDLECCVKNALRSAVVALFLDDNSDYKNALFEVVHQISQIPYSDLNDETLRAIYYLFEPA